MKHQTQKRKRGFSLVELMISLIAISLITAAFAPIVTKKLSSMGVTVGSFGSGGNNSGGEAQICTPGFYYKGENSCGRCSDVLNNCEECSSATRCTVCAKGYQIDPATNHCISTACAETGGKPSEKCCAEFKAKFIPKEKLGTSHDLCMMQYNAGDDGNAFLVNGEKKIYNPDYVKYNISMDRPGTDYVSKYSPAQCWAGNENVITSGKTIYNNYNANTRTVCDFEAAVRICAIWAPNGSTMGAWRLLTENEATNLATAINSETTENIKKNLTRYKPADADDDFGLQLCDGNTSSYGMNQCPRSQRCIGGDYSYCQPYYVWIDTKRALGQTNDKGKFGIVGTTTSRGGSVRCVTENVYTADVSNDVYNQGESDPVDEYEPQSQEDCNPYNALYINKKYIGGEKNICMFKYNAGDDSESNANLDYIKIGVSMDKAGKDNASKYSPAQCWKGTTSGGSGPYKYLPKERTVCDFEAAKRICAAWEYGDTKPGDWRLLNSTEATELAKMLNIDSYYSNYFSRYLNNDGLQLCDGSSQNYGMNSCPRTQNCIGGDYSYCQPYHVWIDTGSTIANTNEYGKFEIASLASSRGGSVRCVSNLIRGGHNTVQKNTYETNEPSKQEDCDKYSALFIDKHIIKAITGVSLSRSLCVTKYNMADKNIVNTDVKTIIGNNTVADYAGIGVTMVDVNTKCATASTLCCWRGDTSSGTSPYAYSANSRTVCNYGAAKRLCEKWNPNKDISAGNWRLLTEQEASALAKMINIDSYYSNYYSKYTNENGLQLCDGNTSNYGMNYCPDAQKCVGTDYSRCHPKGVLIENAKILTNTNENGKFEISSLTAGRAASVRCVSDTVAVE